MAEGPPRWSCAMKYVCMCLWLATKGNSIQFIKD